MKRVFCRERKATNIFSNFTSRDHVSPPQKNNDLFTESTDAPELKPVPKPYASSTFSVAVTSQFLLLRVSFQLLEHQYLYKLRPK